MVAPSNAARDHNLSSARFILTSRFIANGTLLGIWLLLSGSSWKFRITVFSLLIQMEIVVASLLKCRKTMAFLHFDCNGGFVWDFPRNSWMEISPKASSLFGSAEFTAYFQFEDFLSIVKVSFTSGSEWEWPTPNGFPNKPSSLPEGFNSTNRLLVRNPRNPFSTKFPAKKNIRPSPESKQTHSTEKIWNSKRKTPSAVHRQSKRQKAKWFIGNVDCLPSSQRVAIHRQPARINKLARSLQSNAI